MAVKIWTGQDASAPAKAEDFQVTWTGAVLALGEHNWYDDSDFYALVWDGEKPVEIEYATTRGWTYRNSAQVDATPEVKAAADAWFAEQRAADAAAKAAAEAAAPAVGKTAVVVRGRKVPVGTAGTIIWVGENKWGLRVGIKDADGTAHWTAASNVEVTAQADE